MGIKTALAAGVASASLAISMLGAGSAFAQSTAGQANEAIVTGARKPPSAAGLAVQVSAPKDEVVITQQFIKTQL